MPGESWLDTLRFPPDIVMDPEAAAAGVMYSLSAFDSVLVNEDPMLSEDWADCWRYICGTSGGERWGWG